jgi:hypothetical protein
MATPHVVGVAALAWSVNPGASVAEIRDVILGGTDSLASLGGRVATGGRLNAYNTLQLLSLDPSISSLSATPNPIEVGTSVTLTAGGITDPGGTISAVYFYQDTNEDGQFDANDLYLGLDTTIVGGEADIVLDTADLAVGSHGFFARAVDDRLIWSSPASTTLTVLAPDDHGDSAATATSVSLEPSTLTLEGDVLTLDPADGFSGELQVIVTVSDGIDEAEETFVVSVTNSLPVLEPIGDQAMSHTEDAITILLEATDADGDPLTYAAEILETAQSNVTLSLNGNLLTIDPADGFAGEFQVSARVSDGMGTAGETFWVSVANSTPVLEPINDRTMPHTQDTISILLAASDADGDPLTYAAELVETESLTQLAYSLDQEIGFSYQGSYYEDTRGMGEKYLRGNDEAWYYVLPNGELYRWGGSIESSPLVAMLDATYYAHPSLLHEARAATSSSVQGSATLSISGNLLTIDPADGFAGEFQVSVTVSDGVETAGETFRVSVTNSTPVLEPIADRTMPHTQDTISTLLAASDADGDQLAYTAEIIQTESLAPIAYDLDQELGLSYQGDYYEDARGLGEKYISGSGGAWYYILPNGELYRWGGSIESSPLVAMLDATYYADPTLLYDAQASTSASVQANATLSLEGNRLTIDPAAGFVGQFQVVVTVSDGVETVGETFAVSVTNSTLVLEPVGNRTMPHTQDTISILLEATDADGDPLSYSADVYSSYATASLEGNLLTVDPADGFVGEFWVSVAVSDGIATVRDAFRISVENAAPVFEPIGNQTMPHTQDTMTIVLGASDADGDPLSYSVNAYSSDVTASLEGNLLTIDPADGYTGAFRVAVQIGDGIETVGETFWVWVNNATPVLEPIADRTMPHTQDTISILLEASDADGDPLSYTAGVYSSYATATLDGNLLTIDPADGYGGEFSLWVRVSDGIATSHDTFTISVENAAPVLEPIGNLTMPHTQDTIGILLAATDADGDPLSYAVNTYSSNVTASLDGNLLTIDPVDGYTGEFWVSVAVSDGIDTARETFTVSVENAAPVLEPIGNLTMPHTQDTISILLAAADADGDPLSYTANVYSSYATASLNGNLLTIDPADGYVGEFQVWVSASDGIATARESFTVSVENAAPVLSPIGNRTMSHTDDTISILLEATDADGDPLSYTANVYSSYATANLDGNLLTIDPVDGYVGAFSVSVGASDGIATARESFTVSVENAAPVLSSIGNQTMSHTDDAISILLEASDANGDQLSYTASVHSSSATATLDGNLLTIDPADGYAGEFQVSVAASDGIDTAGETFWVSVTNSTPVLEAIGNRTLSHTQDTLSILLEGTDADGDELIYTASVYQGNATVSLAGDVLTVYPADGFVGDLRVSVTASDGMDTVGEAFLVSVTNSTPVLEPIGSRTMSHTEDAINILLEATDADGDPLSYSADVYSSYATASLEGNLLTVDPADGFVGYFRVSITASDGMDTASETFWVSVTNSTPVLEAIDNRTMPHSQDTMTIELEASDADGDPLTFAANVYSTGATASLNGNLLTIDPADGFAGEFWVSVTASDGIGTVRETFTVTVENVAPVLGSIGNRTMSHSQDTMTIVLEASDADGDPLTFATNVYSTGATASISGNLLTIDPADGFIGYFQVSVTASDGMATAGETFWVSVINSTPVLEPIGNRTMPHSQDTMTIALEVSDADGDPLTFAANVYSTSATASLNGNLLTIDPADGFAGGLWVSVTATDGIDTAEETFRITVENVAPVLGSIGNQTISHTQDTISIALEATDADGDVLSYTADVDSDNATASLNGNVLTIDPADGFAGQFQVSVTASDGVATVGETFWVSVTNSAPVLEPIGDQTMPHSQDTMTIRLAATDADADQLTYTAEIVDPQSLARLAYDLDQEIGFVDQDSYYEDARGMGEKYLRGSDETWYYVLSNGELYRWSGSIEASPLVATLDATYHDDPTLLHEAQPIASASAHGNATLSLVGDLLTIDPADGFAGEFQVSVTASDGIATVGETFTVSVTNSTLVLEPIGDRTMSHTQDTMTILLEATDADGDPLSYVAEVLAPNQDNATVSLADNVLTIDPADGFAGEFQVSVTVSDGIEALGETFTVSVTNSAPVLEPIGDRTMSHTQDTLTIVLTATDADGDELTYTARLVQTNVAEGVIGLDGDQDWFAFEAVAGTTYRFYTELVSLTDSTLSLFDQDGSTLIASDNDGGNGLASSITWTADANGTYYLSVAADDGAGSGEYRLHFDVQNDAPAPDSTVAAGPETDAAVDSFQVRREPPPATDLGTVDFRQLNALDLTGGDLLYVLETDHDGWLSVEAVYQGAPEDVTLTLYDANFLELATGTVSTAGERIDFNAAAGEVYFVGLAGDNADVDLRLANLVHHGGSSVTVHGTAGSDTLRFSAGDVYELTINGFLYQFASGDVSAISFDGGAGNDLAVLSGSAENDVAVMYPHWTALYGSGYQVVVSGASRTVVRGGGGSDRVYMYDSAGNDTFIGASAYAEFYGSGFYNFAKGFDLVQAYATKGGSDAKNVSAVDYVLATFGGSWRDN